MPELELTIHTSVLLSETVAAFSPYLGKVYVDVTLGGAGHTIALAEKLTAGQMIIGLDRDPEALALAQRRLDAEAVREGVTIKLCQSRFSSLQHQLYSNGVEQIDGGLMADLGMSNIQLKSAERGFSFQTSAPLDMRMGPDETLTAADVVNGWDEDALVAMMKDYADERLAKPIARLIVQRRAAQPFETTKELAELAASVYRHKNCNPRNIHPATRLFQALRMAVNSELQELEALLKLLPELMAPGAIAAFIPFHSIEDRVVKQFFRIACADCICPPGLPVCQCGHQPTFEAVGKPITPSEDEIARNPQARSAKLRVYRRL